MRRLLSSATALAAAVVLGAAPSATWSVVVVDTATGEACVASATCLAFYNLKSKLPVVVPEHGVAAAQSFIDVSGVNKLKIWKNLQLDKTPEEILAILAASDAGHQSRQYGIVSFGASPVTFSGTIAGEAKEGVVGEVGTLKYAIQGNVLTGDPVVYAAETALLSTTGPLADRVMAAMEAARALGGDGRCSCSASAPTSCGVPPPSFTKSAHCGFLILARHGNTNGTCTAAGCATATYHIDLNVANQDAEVGDLDPVLQLQAKYATWKTQHVGHADHLASTVSSNAQSLVADAHSSLQVTVELVDLDGVPVGHGGAALTIAQSAGAAGVASAGPVVDLGDGRYQFDVSAGASAGDVEYEITVADGTYTVELFPALHVRVDPLQPLHCGYDSVSATSAAAVPLTLNAGASLAAQPYFLLASAAGTSPGVALQGGATLPLNPDALLLHTLQASSTALFAGSAGVLDADGRASALLELAPAVLAALPSARLDFAAVVRVAPLVITNAAGFDVAP